MQATSTAGTAWRRDVMEPPCLWRGAGPGMRGLV
jgi:hypothetical protein